MVGEIFAEGKLVASEEMHAAYISADPFPSAALHDLVNLDRCRELENSFPAPEAELAWRDASAKTADGKIAQARKLGFSDEWQLPDVFRDTLWAFNSARFLRFLEGLTGISNLIADPHYIGAGLHQYSQGAELRAHADFNKHPTFRLDRRLNVLLFLNSDWNEDWLGHLDLWDESMSSIGTSIPPTIGTLAVFNTTRTSYHAVRGPLQNPPDRYRRSLAFYYYTNGRDDGHGEEAHGTLWQTLPEERE